MNVNSPFGSMMFGGLPIISSAETRSICAENPTGERAGGAKETPDQSSPASMLGKGWKVKPCLNLEPESLTTIAEIEGPAVIQHMWFTTESLFWRDLILRVYWDGEAEPSIEVPLGDFFVCGHNVPTHVNSLPIAVNPKGGFNSYWPMPFRKSAKITIENQRHLKIDGFFFQITYSLQDVPEDAAYFHAQWRRSMTTREHPEHVIVDNIKGTGHYVGTSLAWVQMSNGWWGEGEVKFFMDGDKEYPTICGTGTEDYFGGAWGFYDENEIEKPFSTAFLGMPLVEHVKNRPPKYSLYRWHMMDPIRFKEDLRVTVQALGWYMGGGGKFQPLTDDIASVAYWYQLEPHVSFPELPGRFERFPR